MKFSYLFCFLAAWIWGQNVALHAKILLPDRFVVVLSADWQSSQGKLFCLEKKGTSWNVVDSWPIILGRNGLGWGLGVKTGFLPREGPFKREGDGKAPAGLFAIRRMVYGYAAKPPEGSLWPYQELTPDWVGVDDSDSKYYNQVFDSKSVRERDWNSEETMRRSDDLYRWLLWLEHNTENPQREKGSCIFLHLWKAPQSPTAGCTAMSEKNLLKLILWLGPEQNPLLLQLPYSHYPLWQKKWGLPSLKWEEE